MKFLILFSSILLIEAREFWWFSTHAYNKVTNPGMTPHPGQHGSEAQQAQAILASSNDMEVSNDTLIENMPTTPHHEPVIIHSKREAPLENPIKRLADKNGMPEKADDDVVSAQEQSEVAKRDVDVALENDTSLALSEDGNQAQPGLAAAPAQPEPLVVASKRDAPSEDTESDKDTSSNNESLAQPDPAVGPASLPQPEPVIAASKRDAPMENIADDNSTLSTVEPPTVNTVRSEPVVVESKREATSEDVVEDGPQNVETNSTDSDDEDVTTVAMEETGTEVANEDIDKKKRQVGEDQPPEDCQAGQFGGVPMENQENGNFVREHPLNRVRRVSKAGSSHKIRNDKLEQNNPYVEHTTPPVSAEDADSDES